MRCRYVYHSRHGYLPLYLVEQLWLASSIGRRGGGTRGGHRQS
ncbi:MAG TPA: hypothetical protein PK186_06955 [candidate division Zixibacteria bacterium]|nr:hypothetical protein [candidate division Zixibacteria bacterium]MDM7973709.1 hypothetical protein [candidate division Zixibacteria bacterium]HOD66428.1 hypothetical protein [candidate division Zixibacteria bacterium]HPM37277.1 hypothetical protein [candidate division Zixibacteria bacterium]